MDLEYQIVGIAKGSEADFEQLYSETHVEIYALALALLKDRLLAREAAVETLRRIKAYAYSFDTNLNAEYWILEMTAAICRNALRDPSVSPLLLEPCMDNISALLRKTLTGLRNEREIPVTLKAVSRLCGGDVARLSGYYRVSSGNEYRRAVKELKKSNPGKSEKELLAELRRDFNDSCPDLLPFLQSDRPTRLAHVSHETILLDAAETKFSENAAAEYQKQAEAEKARRKKLLKFSGIAAAIALVLALGVTACILLYRKAQTKKTVPETAPQAAAKIELFELAGKVYFRDASTGIYEADPENGTAPVRICDGTVRDLVTDGTFLFFRENGKIFRIRPDGSARTQLTAVSGSTLTCYKGYLYFSASDGIYRISAAEAGPDTEPECVYREETEAAPARYWMQFSEDGRLFFSGGADGGLYEVRTADGVNDLIPLCPTETEVYFFQIDGSELYFDVLIGDRIYLQMLDLETGKFRAVIRDYFSYTAAYCVRDGFLYFEGYRLDASEASTDIGLYRLNLSADSEKPEFLFEIPESELHISDMYAEANGLYCYYSDGKTNGRHQLIRYALPELDKPQTIF